VHTLASLREKLMLEWTYHSNAIEGNTLTLRETKVVLEGITVGGKSLREHFEATNHRDAILYVEEIVAKNEALSEWYDGATQTHPVERAVELHTRFVKIHPFIGGNGRTGRLLLNFELMKAGYPPAIIQKEDRLEYYDSLDEACVSGDYSSITQLVANSVQRSLDTYLERAALAQQLASSLRRRQRHPPTQPETRSAGSALARRSYRWTQSADPAQRRLSSTAATGSPWTRDTP
jgi:Fic family protein